MGGNSPYGQDRQLNRPGEFRPENTSGFGDFNARLSLDYRRVN